MQPGFQPYYIFMDIDGTLLTGQQMHPETRRALMDAHEKGHYLIVNTARPYESARTDRRLAGIPFDGISAGMGASVHFRGKLLRLDSVPMAHLLFAFGLMKETGTSVVFEAEEGFLGWFAEGRTPWCQTVADEAELEAHREWHFSKLATTGGPAPEEVCRELERYFDVYRHGHYTEVAIPGHDKGTAIRDILATEPTDREHIIAIGDSCNDMGMLRLAGISVAVGNATDDVKAVCTVQAPSSAEGGVGIALREILHL